jgi:hypothetical protein
MTPSHEDIHKIHLTPSVGPSQHPLKSHIHGGNLSVPADQCRLALPGMRYLGGRGVCRADGGDSVVGSSGQGCFG